MQIGGAGQLDFRLRKMEHGGLSHQKRQHGGRMAQGEKGYMLANTIGYGGGGADAVDVAMQNRRFRARCRCW